jgi:putative zinc finger protein
MCPDKNLLSAYFDGELKPKFSLKLEAHIVECESCTRILEEFRALSTTLNSVPQPEALENKEATWQLLHTRFSSLYPTPVWKRRLQIPAPVIAAMAVLVILLGVGLLFSLNSSRGYDAFDTVTGARFETAEYATFDEILQHLDARGGQTYVFTLPQDTKVQFWSEPQLIRAADYKRGVD